MAESTDAFTVALKKGEVLFREGDEGSDVFVIENGRIELSAGGATRTLEMGDLFGTRALASGRREVTATALTPSRLIRLNRDALTSIVRAQPEIALLMLRGAARDGVGAPAASASTGVLIHTPSNTRFPLEGDDLLIGRSSRASGYTADIDLSALDPDRTLSRKHARILRTPDGLVLKEEEGRNGTFVNGDRIGPGQTVRLEEGDRIRFGLVEVVFRSR
ncbi:MAG TPA: FHA domain-containing protein [Vicinamibacterales bacterium]